MVNDGDGLYLPMLQGKKEMWIKWWLYNRFRYLDSKYCTGSSMENRITIRAHQKSNVFLKAYANIVGHVFFNAAMVEKRMERGVEYEFEWPASGAEDPVIGINDADLLTSLGDLSPLMVELIDVSGAPHLTELKVGDGAEGYVNYSMNSITLGNNILLRSLDLRNCVNLTQSVDASGCTNIEEVYLDGTAVTGVSLPNGGILKTLHLPGTVTNLTVLNQKAITDFTMPSYDNVTTLRVENSPSIPAMDILLGMPANSRVRIIGIDCELETAGFLSTLNSMRGLDENGNNVDTAQVSGRIHVAFVTPNQASAINAAKATYPSLTITYDEVGAYLTHQLIDRSISGAYENDRITHGGAHAFYGCAGLTSLKLPNMTTAGAYMAVGIKNLVSFSADKLTEVPEYGAFSETGIIELCLPSVRTIKNYSLNKMNALKKVDLPVCTGIGYGVFTNSTAIETLILRSGTVCTIGDLSGINASKISAGTGYIYVPRALVDSYKSATNWSTYASQIRAIEDYPAICGGA